MRLANSKFFRSQRSGRKEVLFDKRAAPYLVDMLLRSSLLRQCRLLQTSQRTVLRSIPLENSISRRSFHRFPAWRYADSTSSDQSTPSETTTETNNPKTEKPTAESNAPAKDTTPPSPTKREPDPKDQEIADLKVPVSIFPTA